MTERFNIGQARKSLWIETKQWSKISTALSVRLVRACGSKQNVHERAGAFSRVRLVRACGSKLDNANMVYAILRVRLVRACGSKQFKVSEANPGYLVRLVRACGSKLANTYNYNFLKRSGS